MMISEEILAKYECIQVSAGKGQYLFHEGDEAICYFQIIEGKVMLVNYSPEGQEFIQGIFTAGQSFGEPPLVGGFVYPSNAVTLEPTVVRKVKKDEFLALLYDHFDLHLKLTKELSERLAFKSMMSKEMANNTPEARILTLVEHYRHIMGVSNGNKKGQMPLTRQQIAGLTGLRVETVIRTIKKMEEKGILELESHKIIFDNKPVSS